VGVFAAIRIIAGINLVSCERWLLKAGRVAWQNSFMQEGTNHQSWWWYRSEVNVVLWNVFALHVGQQLLNTH